MTKKSVQRPGLRYNWSERKRRTRVVQLHRQQYGELCFGWGVPAHPAGPKNPLCADHVIEVHQGGSEGGPLQVLCRRCNSRKSNATRAGRGSAPAVTASQDW